MMKKCFVSICLYMALFASASVRAEVAPLTFDLADHQVNITTGFTGTSLALFGDKTVKGDVVVVLEGPARHSIVRRKDQILGAWINRGWQRFENIPSYYDYAISVENEEDLMVPEGLREARVGKIFLKAESKKKRYDDKTVKNFQAALLRTKRRHDLYPEKPKPVVFYSDNFFRVDFDLPSNVPSGEYTVRALLIDKGRVIYEQNRKVHVGLMGFSSDIYEFARHHSFLYGVMCVVIACFAGWFSNFLVRRS